MVVFYWNAYTKDMNWEHGIDSHGNETDGWGVPYNESFTQQEIKRLGFEIWLLLKDNDESDISPDPEFEAVPREPVQFLTTTELVNKRMRRKQSGR